MTGPTLSVSLPSYGAPPGADWRALLDLARAADDAGVDRVVIPDHVVMGPNTDEYQWGRFPLPPDGAWMEPLTVLTAMAAVTSHVRLATGILIAPLRPAAFLAKQVATLDQLSLGRVDLGVGTGWQREEYDAEGLDFARRGTLLEDTIGACRALWEQAPASFSSSSVNFDGIWCEPKPVQERLPVWFSGTLNDRILRRVVDLGDAWIPIMGATVDDIRDGAIRLRDAFAEAGRKPSELRVQAPALLARNEDKTFDVDATMASVPTLVDAGATDVQVNLRAFCGDWSDAPAAMTRIVEAFQRHAFG